MTDNSACKWYYRPVWVWILILSVGPLALPFLLLSPRFTKFSKFVISIILLILSYYFIESGILLYRLLNNPDEMMKYLKEHLSEDQFKSIQLILENFRK